MEYYSAMKSIDFESVLVRSMNPEPVIQSEASHKKKKQIWHIKSIYMKSRKMVLMNLFVGSNKDADIESKLVDTAGECWSQEN